MKLKLIKSFSLLVFLLNITIIQALGQDLSVSGRVLDESGAPIPGANIRIVGTPTGAVTDIDGVFSVIADPVKDTLVISFIGFEKQQIAINGRTKINVTLIPEIWNLSEVLVIAYSEKKKTEISSAVVSLKNEDINKVTTNNVEDMLIGKVAGVQVQNTSGQPGQVSDIRIRGVGSVFSSQKPLVVVDGIIGGAYDPNNIESVSILKDAGATGLYGSRAAAGVILISTKSGASDHTNITAKIKRGIKQPEYGNFEVMNSEELYDYHKSIYPSALFSVIRPKSLLKEDYNWIDNTYKQSDYTNAYLSFSGGKQRTNYFLSLDYVDEQGTLIGTDFTKMSFLSKIKYSFSDRFSITTNVTGQYNYSRYPHWTLSQGAFRLMPWDSPYDGEGKLVYDIKEDDWYSNVTNNPYHSLQYNKYDNYGLNSTQSVTVDYSITYWLKFESRTSSSFFHSKYEEIESPQSYEGAAVGGRIFNDIDFGYSYGNTSLLKFSETFNKHSISGLAGIEGGKFVNELNYGGNGTGILAGQEVLGVAGSIEKAVGTKIEVASFSVLSQLNYDFVKKYFITFSARRDGSSKFSPNTKYANFYTASASWLVSGENFMKTMPNINYLKLRSSYGAVGNETFPDDDYYPYFPSYSSGYIYNNETAYYPSNIGNYNLTWETSYPFNAGVDIGIFKKFEINLDYYNTHTKDLLFRDPLPSSQGFDYQWKNVGEIQNTGIELAINGNILKTKDFTWDINFNTSSNHNELVKLSDKEGVDDMIITTSTFRQILEPGKSAFEWYMPKWLGVDPENGKPLWEKVIVDEATGLETGTEKTSVYNESTFQSVGSPFPKFMGGFGTAVDYKGISLSATFSYVYGNKIYHYTRQELDNDGANLNINAYKLQDDMSRWEEPGDNATHPEAILGGNSNANEYSSRYLEDGSYLRLRNVTLSYKLPKSIVEKAKLKNVVIGLSADNLITWTKFTGMDPDVPLFPSSWSLPGVSSFKYPISRQFNASVEISF